jgi:hypothetical protein
MVKNTRVSCGAFWRINTAAINHTKRRMFLIELL